MTKKEKQPERPSELLIIRAIGEVADSLIKDDKKLVVENLDTLILRAKEYHTGLKREVIVSGCDEIRFKDYADFINSLRIFAFSTGIFERIEAFKKQFEIE
jgi:hypothetical protein